MLLLQFSLPQPGREESYEHLLVIAMSQSSDHSELEEGCQLSLLASKLRLETVGSSEG